MAENPAEPDRVDAAFNETARLLAEDAVEQALEQIAALHPADQAEVFGRLEADERAGLLPNMTQGMLAEIVVYLRDDLRRDVVADLEPAALGPLLGDVAPDVAADILHDLPRERTSETLASMSGQRAAKIASLLPYADESAGGRMTSDFVALHKQWTVDEALSHLRSTQPDAEQAFYLYVVDQRHRLEGVVSLRHLVVGAPEERISGLMAPEVVSVGVEEDQEEVVRRVQRYNLVALPVVDGDRRLVGVIGVDDLMDVAEEEATEDMYRMVGLIDDESLLRPIGRSLAPRLLWLLIALVSGFAAAGVVDAFEGTIEQVVTVAVFMPIIVALGGNAGVQTITLMVRSLALGQVEWRNVGRILQRELIIGIVNGIVVGLLVGVAAYAWKGNVALAVVAGVAMLLNIATGVTAGVLVPLVLRLLRLDPALASGVLVTTLTDALGFFFFLGLATLMVDRLG